MAYSHYHSQGSNLVRTQLPPMLLSGASQCLMALPLSHYFPEHHPLLHCWPCQHAGLHRLCTPATEQGVLGRPP